MGHLMVLLGGYSHRHHNDQDSSCSDNRLHFYDLHCRTWLDPDILEHFPRGHQLPWPDHEGAMAHSTIVRGENQLFVTGGYKGVMSKNVYAYKLPGHLILSNRSLSCAQYISGNHCLANPHCGWCGVSGYCADKNERSDCQSNILSKRCPGPCSVLQDCRACFDNPECLWCKSSEQCQSKSDYFRCEDEQESDCLDSSSDVLVAYVYLDPGNESAPDDYVVLNETKITRVMLERAFEDALSLTPLNQTDPGLTVILKGSLRVLKSSRSKKWVGETLHICQGPLTTLDVEMSPPDGGEMQVVLSEDRKAASLWCHSRAKWRSGKPIYLYPGAIHDFQIKLRMAIMLGREVFTSRDPNPTLFSMSMFKKGGSRRIITSDYLLPYQSGGDCKTAGNCLKCLQDSQCAWHPSNSECISKDAIDKFQFDVLTLNLDQCTRCQDYLTCQSCLSASHANCEWQTRLGRCVRLGRSEIEMETVRNSSSKCLPPCHQRGSCSACLEDDCVWCQSTQECFAFSSYTTRFAFGRCSSWTDRLQVSSKENDNDDEVGQLCPDCSAHRNCSTCLEQLRCGWSYLPNDPLSGQCKSGSFDSNDVKVLKWAYDLCPDIDECRLNLHDCDDNNRAECLNTPSGYECKCLRGYEGDGKRCYKSCYYDCVHGECSGDYECDCDLGWTGSGCDVDCGCHGHADCPDGVGVCGECQHGTRGDHCELCDVGFFGNATDALQGCQKCQVSKIVKFFQKYEVVLVPSSILLYVQYHRSCLCCCYCSFSTFLPVYSTFLPSKLQKYTKMCTYSKWKSA